MRILILANNWVGWQLTEWLKSTGENLVGLVIHAEGQRQYGDQIIHSAGVSPACIFAAPALREPETLRRVAELKPDIAVSLFFGQILRPEFTSIFTDGVVNLHPAYLPFNRGAFPNVWSIVDRTPAGVTLHYIDERVDTGDIIAQREVPVLAVDTGKSLYQKLEFECVSLFRETWPLVRSRKAPRIAQTETGTSHRVRDVNGIDEINLDRTYVARDLIDILRARTFAPYKGAYFTDGERRVYLRLDLSCEDEVSDDDQKH